jgi:hypothetical protein
MKITEIGIHEDFNCGGYFARAYLSNGQTLDVSFGWETAETDEVDDDEARLAVALEYPRHEIDEDCPVRHW